MEPTVKRYSHHFIISDVDSTYQRGIDAFARRLVQTESNMDRFGNIITSKVHTFAVRHGFEMAYRFHINHLEQLTEFLASGGLRFDAGPMVDLYVPSVANFQVKDGWVPRDDQVPVVDYLSSPGLKKVVDAQTGSGKGLLHGTPVRTINGWTNVEDLTTNDMVMGETGAFHNVVGVFPQGDDLDLYEFTFADGRTIVTDESHLWEVKTQYVPSVTLSSKEILDIRDASPNKAKRMYIPLLNNLESPDNIELPIDPYFLGVLLGDGHLSETRMAVSKPDMDLHLKMARIADAYGWDYRISDITRKVNEIDGGGDCRVITGSINAKSNAENIKLYDTARELGLIGLRSETKFIPEIYMRASANQRLELVRGLLDTDGYGHGGSIEYGTTSPQLMENMKELLYSLGCIVKITEKIPTYDYRGEKRVGQLYYRFSIRTRNPANLFTLPSKVERSQNKTQYTNGLSLRIDNVRKLPHKGSTTCISVDNPTKLFVTKDYLVTHNTIMTMFALAKVKVRCALVVKPMYISRWMDVLVGKDMVFKNFGSKDVMTVRGSAQMSSIINLAREGEFNVDFVVISNRTYINYLQHYDENGPSEEYGWCRPEELWNLLGVGIRLIDEAHQDFYGCFLTDLHSHVPTSIELSGSLEPDMDFLKAMYAVMYPKALRMNTGVYKRYVDIIGLLYSLDTELPHPRTTRRGRASYSQAAYEEAIIKVPMRTRRLQEMMSFICNNYFMSERLPDHKLLVFFDTVGMCAIMADYYQELYPDLYVSKYTEEEDPSVLDEADIIIATPASAGTAVDITNLQQVHSFVMRSSTQALIQMLGRLRKLSTDTISPKYLYICTNDIITHQKYQYKMQEVFRFRAKNQEQRALPHVI